MIKRTRMIVLTKEKILLYFFAFTLFCVSLAGIVLLSQRSENITAFSSYERILSNEFMPDVKEAEGEKDGKKNGVVKEKEPLSNKILKSFFVIGLNSSKSDIEEKSAEGDKSTNNAENQTAQTSDEKSDNRLLSSESKTINRGMTVSNSTNFNVNPIDYVGEPLSFSLDNNVPEILIMHTHTTESYSEAQYQKGAPDRNLDEQKNVTAVGRAMKEIFEKNGIGVCHDSTVHDYPSYNGAYQRAASTIGANLKKFPGVKVVLDVHRDGITKEDGTKVKLVSDVGGESAAQIMLVVGTNANLEHNFWQENFKFASKIQAKAIEKYPTLMRPIDLREERFNEQMTKGSLIVEVGTNGNTLDEAILGGRLIAEIISEVLKGG